MRPLWFEFPEDPAHFETDDEFMWGPALLVAPVMEEGASQRAVYLPSASVWYDAATGERAVLPCPALGEAVRVRFSCTRGSFLYFSPTVQDKQGNRWHRSLARVAAVMADGSTGGTAPRRGGGRSRQPL